MPNADFSTFSIQEMEMMHDALDQEVCSVRGAINLPRTTGAVSDWLEDRMHTAFSIMDAIISEVRRRRPIDDAEQRHRLLLLTIRELGDIDTPGDLEAFAKSLAAENAS